MLLSVSSFSSVSELNRGLRGLMIASWKILATSWSSSTIPALTSNLSMLSASACMIWSISVCHSSLQHPVIFPLCFFTHCLICSTLKPEDFLSKCSRSSSSFVLRSEVSKCMSSPILSLSSSEAIFLLSKSSRNSLVPERKCLLINSCVSLRTWILLKNLHSSSHISCSQPDPGSMSSPCMASSVTWCGSVSLLTTSICFNLSRNARFSFSRLMSLLSNSCATEGVIDEIF
mmetsp:Transcript_23328/g.32550  ORF Transcript_23328/g.32550 Transcript_23328/m.32550 type:complete len:231 (-) Transcript_23328:341-1033(-)